MRNAKNLVYLGLLAAALVIGFERWKVLAAALASSACYFASLPLWPVWAPLGVALAGYLGFFLWLLLSHRPARLLHHAVALFLFAAVVLMRTWEVLAASPQTEWRAEDEAPPPLLMARAAVRLKRALDERKAGGEPYPLLRQEVEELLREKDRMPPSGFLGHARRLPMRVEVVSEADGPVLAPRPGDRPGTLYFAVSEDGSRYWITLLGLAEYPCGAPALIAREDREPLILEAGESGGGEE